MKFTDMLKKDEQIIESTKTNEVSTVIFEKEKTPEEILRGANFKIKLVTPTSFGTQIDFAKIYDEDKIKELLKDFTIKIKNKSVFIVD